MRTAILKAVVYGGLLGGALDLLFALSSASVQGAAPVRVFQSIASGWLGAAAFSGGTSVIMLGVFSHFALSVLWAALFAMAAWRLPVLTRMPAAVSVSFGILVFLIMRLVVLPLSAYPGQLSFKPLASTLDLLSHIVLFALPIVLFVTKATRPPD